MISPTLCAAMLLQGDYEKAQQLLDEVHATVKGAKAFAYVSEITHVNEENGIAKYKRTEWERVVVQAPDRVRVESRDSREGKIECLQVWTEEAYAFSIPDLDRRTEYNGSFKRLYPKPVLALLGHELSTLGGLRDDVRLAIDKIGEDLCDVVSFGPDDWRVRLWINSEKRIRRYQVIRAESDKTEWLHTYEIGEIELNPTLAEETFVLPKEKRTP